jgi:hypothetical protein
MPHHDAPQSAFALRRIAMKRLGIRAHRSRLSPSARVLATIIFTYFCAAWCDPFRWAVCLKADSNSAVAADGRACCPTSSEVVRAVPSAPRPSPFPLRRRPSLEMPTPLDCSKRGRCFSLSPPAATVRQRGESEGERGNRRQLSRESRFRGREMPSNARWQCQNAPVALEPLVVHAGRQRIRRVNETARGRHPQPGARIQPLVDFGMAVRKGKAAGPIVMRGRQVGPIPRAVQDRIRYQRKRRPGTASRPPRVSNQASLTRPHNPSP